MRGGSFSTNSVRHVSEKRTQHVWRNATGKVQTHVCMRRLNRPPPKRRKRQRTQVHRHCLEPRPHSAYMQTASETTTAIIKGPFERLSSAAPHGGPITTRTFTSLAPAQVASTWPLLRTSGDVTLIGKPTWTRAVAMTSHQRCIKLQLITRGLALAVSTGAPDIS